jgi:hypothetical protein
MEVWNFTASALFITTRCIMKRVNVSNSLQLVTSIAGFTMKARVIPVLSAIGT